MQRILRHSRGISTHNVSRRFSTAAPAIQNLAFDSQKADNLKVHWSDGTESLFPSIYLRDNCLATKTLNGQRLHETHQLTAQQLKISDYTIDEAAEQLNIKWNDDLSHTFSSEWLFENSCNETHRNRRKQQLDQNRIPWGRDSFTFDPICNYKDIEQHKIGIYSELRKYGLCLINSAPIDELYDDNNDPPVINVGETLGFVRTTNYGKYFDVISLPSDVCNHLAYTTAALSCHTDNPYRSPTPGIQLLHCLKQAKAMNANDGCTKLIDGFRIAKEMEKNWPEEYELLTSIKRPFTYYDLKSGYKFHKEQYVIDVNERGNVEAIHFNNRSASCVDWDIDENMIERYYNAWTLFGKFTNDEEYAVEYRLEPGQILIFDNNRVLHGRNGYVGEQSRHLQSCYIDRDTVWARLDAAEHSQNDHLQQMKGY